MSLIKADHTTKHFASAMNNSDNNPLMVTNSSEIYGGGAGQHTLTNEVNLIEPGTK